MKSVSVLIALLCITIVCLVYSSAQDTGHSLTKADYDKVVSNPDNDEIFDAFLKKLPTIIVGTETQHTYYILEGDLLQTREQVRSSIQSYANTPRPLVPSGELKVMMDNGKRVFWEDGKRTLTYAVDRRSFASQENYDTVVANMAEAAADWVNICPDECGLKINHQAEFDDNPNLDKVTFIVTYRPNENAFIAASFFPNDPI